MTTRLLIAYSLIAGLATAGLVALWFAVLRQHVAMRRGRHRFERARGDARDAAGLAYQTD